MGKGILLEVEGRNGVVLTPKGEFKRVPLPRRGACDVGDEIAYAEKSGLGWGWVAAAAAVLLMLFSPFGYQTWSLAQPVALVLIDINPSIELTVNGREQVIKARGLNADGEAVLQAIDWHKRPVDEVTREITAEAVAEGKLDPTSAESTVVVAVAPLGEKDLPEQVAGQIVDRSRTAVQAEVKAQAEARGQGSQAQVAVMEATREEVKEAKAQGMTLPKLMILQEVQLSNPELEVDEEIRKKGPGQIIKDLNLNPGDVFGKAEERHNKKDDLLPANAKGRSDKPEGPGSDEKPGKPDEKGAGKSNKPDKANKPEEKGNPKSNSEEEEESKGQGRGRGSSGESRGLLHEIKVRLGIGVSDDDAKADESEKGRGNAEKGRENPGRGGQEKDDSKENEGSRGNNRP